VGPVGNHHGRAAYRIGHLPQPGQDALVPAVHPIKGAAGHDGIGQLRKLGRVGNDNHKPQI
jgi:hypothetical protein